MLRQRRFLGRIDQKPAYGNLSVDPSHPLNYGLYYWFLANEYVGLTAWDRIRGLKATLVGNESGNPIWRMSGANLEVCLYTKVVPAQRVSLPDSPVVNDFTLIYRGYRDAVTTLYPCALGYLDGLSYTNYVLIYAFHNAVSAPRFAIAINSGTEFNGTFTWAQNDLLELAVVRRSNNIEFYRNGVSQKTPAASGAGTTTLVNGNIGCSLADNNYCAQGCHGVELYTRALTAAELVQHYAAPYGTADRPRVFSDPYRRRYGTYVPSFRAAWVRSRSAIIQPGVH